MPVYKTVNVSSLHGDEPTREFEKLVNRYANDGWELHSLIPQLNEGSVYNNIAVFVYYEEEGDEEVKEEKKAPKKSLIDDYKANEDKEE